MLDASTSAVLRGADAHTLTAARFDVDLRAGIGIPEKLVADARAAAHAAGFAAGWTQGQREADIETQQLREHLITQTAAALAAQADNANRALRAVAVAAAALEARTVTAATDIEELILQTAFSIAEAVLARELEVATEPGRDALRRALALAPGNRPVTIRLNPADHAALTADGQTRQEIDGRPVSLVADATLNSGDALADCDATAVDARIGTALDRVREVLAP